MSPATDGAACPTLTPSSDKQSPQEMIDRFEEGTATMGSPGQGVKAIVNSGHRDDVLVDDPYLLRAFRLRFEIKPPAIDIEDPWAEEPQFDPTTQAGPVASARWATFGKLPAESSTAWPATLWSRSGMSFHGRQI
jgi:hypothetical protein